jgi:hypothetical protein
LSMCPGLLRLVSIASNEVTRMIAGPPLKGHEAFGSKCLMQLNHDENGASEMVPNGLGMRNGRRDGIGTNE